MLDRLLRRTDAAEEPLLAEVRAGGRPFDRIVFTRNARVMVSLGDGGRALRLNERFREAPPEVLRAIGKMYSPRRGRVAAAGRALVREYIRGLGGQGEAAESGSADPYSPDARPRSPRLTVRRRSELPGDRAHIDRLRREFEAVNAEHFAGALPGVPISLSGRMKRRNGHFSPDPLEIVISRRLCLGAHPRESEMTLRHEMIHLWQHVQGRRPGHGQDFRACAARIGVHPRATRAVCWGA